MLFTLRTLHDFKLYRDIFQSKCSKFDWKLDLPKNVFAKKIMLLLAES